MASLCFSEKSYSGLRYDPAVELKFLKLCSLSFLFACKNFCESVVKQVSLKNERSQLLVSSFVRPTQSTTTQSARLLSIIIHRRLVGVSSLKQLNGLAISWDVAVLLAPASYEHSMICCKQLYCANENGDNFPLKLLIKPPCRLSPSELMQHPKVRQYRRPHAKHYNPRCGICPCFSPPIL